jgi:hypothetical protein
MKRARLRRRAKLRARTPLQRNSALQRTPGMTATDAQRAAAAGRSCIVSGADGRIDPARLRSGSTRAEAHVFPACSLVGMSASRRGQASDAERNSEVLASVVTVSTCGDVLSTIPL